MKDFRPAYGLGNKHLQTLYSSFFRKNIDLDFEIEKFTLSDGDFLEAYWLNKAKKDSNTPIVIILHGLQGSYTSPYINGIMNELNKNSFSCVLMHFRSCSGKMNKKLRSYHSGETEDLREFVKSIKSRFPKNDLYIIAYSLGGNVLLKYLGEEGALSLFKAAVSICAPLDLELSSYSISKGFSKVYELNILRTLKRDLLLKYEEHDIQMRISLKKEDVKDIKTIREFDEVYTSKINHFKNASNYYSLSSSKQYLKHIKTNTLLIHSLDDPFMVKEMLPSKKELSDFVSLEVYNNGGHLGFISGSIINPIYWLDLKILEYFKESQE